MNNSTKTILGILAAGAVGVAIGMLLAPEKGSDLRQSLKGTIDDLGGKLNEMLSEGKEKVSETADNIRNKVDSVKNDMNTTLEHGKQIVS